MAETISAWHWQNFDAMIDDDLWKENNDDLLNDFPEFRDNTRSISAKRGLWIHGLLNYFKRLQFHALVL